MNKVDKNTLVPIGLAISVALFAMSVAAKTSSRFISLEKDVIYYAKSVDELSVEIKDMNTTLQKLRFEINSLHGK